MFQFGQSSTQNFLKFSQIKKGTIILKNKALRGILLVSSINFDLISEKEQRATLYQFQSFLNSLDFSVQISVQSRKLNITGYFDRLKELEEKQTNELLKVQTTGYREFIEDLVEEETIMKKTFLVVVPFTLLETKGMAKNLITQFSLGGGNSRKEYSGLGEEAFNRCRDQLWQRMEYVAVGLRRCGLTAVPLTSHEIIELYWSLYHPRQAEFGYYPEILPELMK